MNKYLLYTLILIIFFLVILLFFCFSQDKEEVVIIDKNDVVEEHKLELSSSHIENEGEWAPYIVSGILFENKIESDGYLVLRVEMNKFFANYPKTVEDIKVFVAEDVSIETFDLGTRETAVISLSDLNRFGEITLFLKTPLQAINETDMITDNIIKWVGNAENGWGTP